MKTICGANCDECLMKGSCGGCKATNGSPFGVCCLIARCYKNGGEEDFSKYKDKLILEFNSLSIPNLPKITNLNALCGGYVNLEYTLENGQKVKLLNDKKIYLGNQVEKIGSERCYGVVGDDDYLLVCEYGMNGIDPEIVMYKKR